MEDSTTRCLKQLLIVFNNVNHLVNQWLTTKYEQLVLFEDNDEIVLKRQGDTVLLHVQLLSTQPSNNQLHHWMRLGAASLIHFEGALARMPGNGALWLVLNVRKENDVDRLLRGLETLLNQRDIWRATAARIPSRFRPSKPSLSSFLY